MNKCFYTGKVITYPSVSVNADNIPFCRFKMAVEKNVGKAVLYDYFDVVAWRSLADKTARMLRENDLVFVAGSTQIRKQKLSTGDIKTVVEIVAAEIEPIRSNGEAPHIDYSSDITPLEQLAK